MEDTYIEAKNRMVRMSARKLRLVADVIRGKDALASLDMLQFMQRKGSPLVAKVLKSAVANAQNNHNIKPDDLYVKEVLINEGTTYKRAKPASKGRVRAILKRTSSIYIKLAVKK